MSNYSWAVNKLKLERAVKTSGPEATEETIKEQYILLGGKVINRPGRPKNAKTTAPNFKKL